MNENLFKNPLWTPDLQKAEDEKSRLEHERLVKLFNANPDWKKEAEQLHYMRLGCGDTCDACMQIVEQRHKKDSQCLA